MQASEVRKTDAVLPTPRAEQRAKSPVFVVGCHRSGTNLLYDTLLSAGGFAIYRGYVPVYKILIPRCGDLRNPKSRSKAISLFLQSKGFRRSGLDAKLLAAQLEEGCRTGGDFLRIVMGGIAQKQDAPRWAVYDPDYVLHIERIKRDLPDALFLHIVRDGRDIALSLSKMGGFRPFPWSSRSGGLFETAIYWQWVVRKGQRFGQMFPDSYLEVRYEELVQQPHSTLARISNFLQHDLDYARIQEANLGSLRETNSSFRAETEASKLPPVNRWRERLSRSEVARIEALVGGCLEDLGYPLSTSKDERRATLNDRWLQRFYPNFLESKLWAKINTPIGRWSNISALEIADSPSLDAMSSSQSGDE